MKFQGKEQYWERIGCGRDRDGSCPAYPDYGRPAGPLLELSAAMGFGELTRGRSKIVNPANFSKPLSLPE